MVSAVICGSTIERSAPAVLRLMNAWAAKVEGKRYENNFHTIGKLLVGQENPVRNRHIGDMKRKSTNTVSLLFINVLNVKLKTMHAVT